MGYALILLQNRYFCCYRKGRLHKLYYQIKSNLSLYSLHYAEACNKLAGPISASLRPGNTAPFEEMSQRWRAVGNTVSDLTGPRFEPQTSRSRDERVTARPTGRLDERVTARPAIKNVMAYCLYYKSKL